MLNDQNYSRNKKKLILLKAKYSDKSHLGLILFSVQNGPCLLDFIFGVENVTLFTRITSIN